MKIYIIKLHKGLLTEQYQTYLQYSPTSITEKKHIYSSKLLKTRRRISLGKVDKG